MPLTNTARGCRRRVDRLVYPFAALAGQRVTALAISRKGRGSQPAGASNPRVLRARKNTTVYKSQAIFACHRYLRAFAHLLLLPLPPAPSHREGDGRALVHARCARGTLRLAPAATHDPPLLPPHISRTRHSCLPKVFCASRPRMPCGHLITPGALSLVLILVVGYYAVSGRQEKLTTIDEEKGIRF